MFKKILIIGCGLIGSSIIRAICNKKLTKNIYIYEKSKKNILVLKNLKIKFKIIKNLEKTLINFDMIIFCTPMSQYQNIIKKLNNFVTDHTIKTDVGSTKELMNIKVKKLLKKKRVSGYHHIQ